LEQGKERHGQQCSGGRSLCNPVARKEEFPGVAFAFGAFPQLARAIPSGTVNIVDEIILRASAERPALVAGDLTLSYEELFTRVSKVSGWLERCPGFRNGSVPRVGLACENGVNYIVLALGILKAGGCLVPLADELTAAERAEVILRTGLCGCVLGKNQTGWSTAGGFGEVQTGASWQQLEWVELACEKEFANLEPAFIRFSSGTTGQSKGVVLSHRKLRERIEAANAGLAIGPKDRVLWMLPMAHHFAVSIILYLYHGACTVVDTSHLAVDILRVAKETRATVIYGAPFHYSLLAADKGNDGWTDLRLAVSTAAPLPEVVARGFFKRFATPLVQGMGIIEVGMPLLNTGGAGDSPMAVGRPLPAYDVELRDDEGMPVMIGRTGELWIKGPGMFDAYLSPWQTCEEICVDGWFATGDIAATDSAGRVYLKGRKKSVLNIGGMKVFPEEVELVLNRHVAVESCRVFGVAHGVTGTLPVAEVILKDDANVTPRELIKWCREVLSVYKVPVRMQFVESLPTTASGKIRRV